MLASGTRVGVEDRAVTVRLPAGVSTSATVKLIAVVDVSSLADWSGMSEIVGGSFTAVTVIVNVWGGLLSTPPLAVPPLSWSCTVTVAVPLALEAGVYVSVPLAEINGCTANSALLLLVTRKFTVWADSFAGP